MRQQIFLSLALVGLVGGGFALADKVSVDGVKCFISGAAAKEDKSVKYLDGTVHFCCENCAKKFDADKDKYAAKANHQLVATKQYEQKACPMSGASLNADTAIDVKGVKVAFCCNNCKGKAEKMADDEKTDKLFGKAAFEKAKYEKVASK
jgi:YHS domain-containing protein